MNRLLVHQKYQFLSKNESRLDSGYLQQPKCLQLEQSEISVYSARILFETLVSVISIILFRINKQFNSHVESSSIARYREFVIH